MQARKARQCLALSLLLGVWLFASDSQALAQWAAYSADSKLLATAAGKGGVVVLWDVPSGKQRRVLKGEPGPIQFMSFSPDGKLLATVALNAKSANLWDTSTGMALSELGDKKQNIDRVVIAPDHQSFLLVTDSASGVLWPSVERSQMPVMLRFTSGERAPKGLKPAVEYSPDGKTLATQAWDGTVKLWNAHNGKERAALDLGNVKNAKVPPLVMPRLSFAPDGKSLLAQGRTGNNLNSSVSLWDAATATEALSGKSLQVQVLHDLTFSPDGKSQALCVVADKKDGIGIPSDKRASIVLRDPASGKQRVLADLGPALLDNKDRDRIVINSVRLAFSPDGKHLLANIREPGDSSVKIWDLKSDKLVATKDGANPRLTPDASAVVVARSRGVKVHELNADIVRQAVLEHYMVIAPDGRTFFSMATDGTLVLWDTSKDGKRTTLALDSQGK